MNSVPGLYYATVAWCEEANAEETHKNPKDFENDE